MPQFANKIARYILFSEETQFANKVGAFGDEITIFRDKSKITVNSYYPLSPGGLALKAVETNTSSLKESSMGGS
ncbi:hypothetical protein C5167_025485 [Papaver somniferum]|uniref:Uncharacterized protein n=1 Tax=Papaver somniferum TaxID=3469 RepID=A0A4Y7JVA6_PAPSO|nr:hypothetical protein C5167_025485 [Papaver somniferum]